MIEEGLLVVKIGGSRGVALEAICDDVALLRAQGVRLVLVHGGSARVDELSERLGVPPRFLRTPAGYLSRYTDARTREIYVQAVSGLNAEIVAALHARGLAAVGLAGRKGCVLLGRRKTGLRAVVDGRVRVIRDDYSGRVSQVQAGALEELLGAGRVPVVPPMAYSEQDGFLNVDGDRVAAVVAGALRADWLVLLSNVPGLMRRQSAGELVRRVERHQLDQALAWAQGRMKRKIVSVREALDLGVPRVVVADGGRPQPLQHALEGGGTWFV
jgi:acetylglutamate/LysW-gamma-L-alpha-aminoadipate kinase